MAKFQLNFNSAKKVIMVTLDKFFSENKDQDRKSQKVIIDYNPSEEFHWIYDQMQRPTRTPMRERSM